MDHNRIDWNSTAGAGIIGKLAKFAQSNRLKSRGQILASHFIQWGKHMKKHKTRFLSGGDSAGKHCARAGGLSECGGKQYDPFVTTCLLEMSLGSHG